MVTKIAPPLPTSLELEGDWPVQGEWTYEDYLRLPDDGRRYEIIRGVLYVVNAPSEEQLRSEVLPDLQIGVACLFIPSGEATKTL